MHDVSPKHTPVLVVGAGSAGMATALELRRHNIPVTVIDAASAPQTESRGIGIQPRTLELLDMYGLGEELAARGQRISALAHHLDGVEEGRIDFTPAPSRYNFTISLPQCTTESLLRDRLVEFGVVPLWGHRITRVAQDDAGATVTIDSPHGELTWRADWVIGADGGRSTMRKLVGLPFDGESYPEAWGLLDVTLDWELPNDVVRVFRLADGPQQFVAAPLGGNSYRVQMDHRPAELADQTPTLEEMQAAFDLFTGHRATLRNPGWASTFTLHRRQVVAYRAGRVFLVGDAAHIHTPAGGQGLNTGIQDGFNLAWKLALVAQGRAEERLLDTYDSERKPIATGVLKLSEILARTPRLLLDDASLSPEAKAARIGQLMVNYRDEALGQEARQVPGLVAGDRLPDVDFNGARTYVAMSSGRIALVVVGDAGSECLNDETRAWVEHSDHVALHHLASESQLPRALGLLEGAFVIRPDGYLGVVVDGKQDSAAGAAVRWMQDRLHLTGATALEASHV